MVLDVGGGRVPGEARKHREIGERSHNTETQVREWTTTYLFVGNNFNSIMLPHAYTGVGGSQIYADCS